MADGLRYFYSKDGTATNGPVSRAVLRQLFQDGDIDRTSYVCAEGATEWVPFTPELVQSHGRKPIPQPAPTPADAEIEEPERHSWLAESRLLDPIFKKKLMVIGTCLAIGGAALDLNMRYVVFAHNQMAADSPGEVLGYFVGMAAFIFVIPYLISLGFGYARQRLACVVLMALFIPLSLAGHHYYLQHNTAPSEIDKPVAASDAALIPRETISHSYVQTDMDFYINNLKSLKQATSRDTTALASVRQDLVTVIDALLEKCMAWNTTAQACHRFDPAGLTSQQDINDKGTAVVTHHDAQTVLYLYLQDIDQHCREAMAADNFGEASVTEAISGFRKAARIDRMLALSIVGTKITDDQVIILKYLYANWGRWSVENGAVKFDSADQLATYNTLQQNFQNDVTAQQPLLTP